jgi:hypothetical protein
MLDIRIRIVFPSEVGHPYNWRDFETVLARWNRLLIRWIGHWYFCFPGSSMCLILSVTPRSSDFGGTEAGGC